MNNLSSEAVDYEMLSKQNPSWWVPMVLFGGIYKRQKCIDIDFV